MAAKQSPADVDFATARALMVHEQLLRRGISDERVLRVMGTVPRDCFVSAELAAEAYGDYPLPIGHGQTISQPFVVARIAELLELSGGERVLDVGAGSGYQTAVLAELCPGGQVFAIERIGELLAKCEQRLQQLHYRVTLSCRDGSLGWPEHAPYDAIAVAAGAPEVPAPLVAQLAEGGRLVIPIGDAIEQRLLCLRKHGGQMVMTQDFPVRFVPLIGEHGFPAKGPE